MKKLIFLFMQIERPTSKSDVIPPIFRPFDLDLTMDAVHPGLKFDAVNLPEFYSIDSVMARLDIWLAQRWRGLMFQIETDRIKILGASPEGSDRLERLDLYLKEGSGTFALIEDKISERIIRLGYENRIGADDIRNAALWSLKR